jgi:hypothetical protein
VLKGSERMDSTVREAFGWTCLCRRPMDARAQHYLGMLPHDPVNETRVESRTGAVTVVSRWLLGEAFASPASIRFGLALFPVPAHRTGLADFPHPALGKDSRCFV